MMIWTGTCERCGKGVGSGARICGYCRSQLNAAHALVDIANTIKQERTDMAIDKGIMSAVANEIRTQGVRKQDDAAHGGLTHDNGGSIYIDRAEYYLMGMNGMIPEGWVQLYQETERRMKSEKAKQSDPEYAEYLRMKYKFERM